MSNTNKNRIIFLDLMRAFAVLMMVQGHTVHTFLAEDLRTTESLFYSLWHFMRGFTAPLFMFTAGVVFTYLLFYQKPSMYDNLRVKRGLKRFLLLLFIGYLLRYPTYKIFDFSDVTQERWLIFFGVDALHLIGFGLLFILILSFLAEKLKVKPYITLGGAALFFVLFYPVADSVNWKQFVPLPVAAYFYNDTGSLFPLFPWAAYVLIGSFLGYYLSQHDNVFKEKKFGINLIILGMSLFVFYFILPELLWLFEIDYSSAILGISTVVLRTGYVIAVGGIFSLFALNLESIPNIVKLAGRHTLLIYVVHLVILYGSAWIPGLYNDYGQTLNIFETLLAVIVMFGLMFAMVWGVEKIKRFRRKKLADLKV